MTAPERQAWSVVILASCSLEPWFGHRAVPRIDSSPARRWRRPRGEVRVCGQRHGGSARRRYSDRVSPHGADPEALLWVARSLATFVDRLAGAEDDLLAAHVSPGDAALQQALDRHVEQVVDTLRALEEVAREQTLALRNAAAAHASAEAAASRDGTGLREAGERRGW